MPISVSCASCEEPYRVRDELLGKKFKCKKCGGIIEVTNASPPKTPPARPAKPAAPARPAAATPARSAPARSASPAPARAASGKASSRTKSAASTKKKKGGKSKTPLFAGVGAGVLALAVVGYFLFAGGKGEDGGQNANVAELSEGSSESSDQPTANNDADTAGMDIAAENTVPENTVAEATSPANSAMAPASSDTPATASGLADPAMAMPTESTAANPATVTSVPSGAATATATPSSATPATGLPTSAELSVTATRGFPLESDPANVDWSGLSKKAMPFPAGYDIIPATTGGPIVATRQGSTVKDMGLWNLCTMKQIGQLANGSGLSSVWSLHAESKTIATLEGTKRTQVMIWSFETGNLVRTIDVEPEGSLVNSVMLLSKDRLLTHTVRSKLANDQPAVRLFDTQTGDIIKSFQPQAGWTMNYVVSPGCKYVTQATKSGDVVVFDTNTMDLVAEAKIVHSGFGTRTAKGQVFSPAGDQIATVWTTTDETKITVTSLADGSTEQVTLPGDLGGLSVNSFVYSGPAIEWLPNSSGWILFGKDVVDAKSKRIVWSIESQEHWVANQRIPMPDGFRAAVGGLSLKTGALTDRKIIFIDCSQAAIAEALAMLDSNAEATVRPGMSVRLEVSPGELRFGDPADVQKKITDWFTERLEADGFILSTTADGLTFRVAYSEQAGQTYHQMKRGRSGLPTETAAGTGIESTIGVFNCEWIPSGQKKAAWAKEFIVAPKFVFVRGELTPQAARDAMFEKIGQTLALTPIAWFVPAKTGTPALPGVTDFD